MYLLRYCMPKVESRLVFARLFPVGRTILSISQQNTLLKEIGRILICEYQSSSIHSKIKFVVNLSIGIVSVQMKERANRRGVSVSPNPFRPGKKICNHGIKTWDGVKCLIPISRGLFVQGFVIISFQVQPMLCKVSDF